MKCLLYSLVVTWIFVLGAQAQSEFKCAAGQDVMITSCQRYIGFMCSGSYPTTFEYQSSSNIMFFEQRVAYCCGLPHTYYVQNGACYSAKWTPDKRKEMLDISEGEEILVADCDGVYLPAKVVLLTAGSSELDLSTRQKEALEGGL